MDFQNHVATALANQRNAMADEAVTLFAQLQLAQQQVRELQEQAAVAERGRALLAQVAAQFGRVARGKVEGSADALEALWQKLGEVEPDAVKEEEAPAAVAAS